MRMRNRARNAIVGAGIALAMATTPAAAGAQAATPDPATATYVATYQRECKAINARTSTLNRRIKNVGRGATSGRQVIVRSGRLLGDYVVSVFARYRRVVILPAPAQFATYQARAKASYLRSRPKVRAGVRAIRRARTVKGFRRAGNRFDALDLPTPPAALRSAAPACRKALS